MTGKKKKGHEDILAQDPQHPEALLLKALQQMVDDFHQPIIEVAVRIAEIDIGLLQQRVEPAIDVGDILQVCRGHDTDQRVVTTVIVRADRKFATAVLAGQYTQPTVNVYIVIFLAGLVEQHQQHEDPEGPRSE